MLKISCSLSRTPEISLSLARARRMTTSVSELMELRSLSCSLNYNHHYHHHHHHHYNHYHRHYDDHHHHSYHHHKYHHYLPYLRTFCNCLATLRFWSSRMFLSSSISEFSKILCQTQSTYKDHLSKPLYDKLGCFSNISELCATKNA